MSIVFERIAYKNFLSAGEQPISLEISSHGSTLISGENGSGKSSLIDAITFACFGRPFRKINKSMLVNSINNSGAEVTLHFRRDTDHYIVERGLKPSFFRVMKNGKELPALPSLPESQTDFESNHLGLTYSTFLQLVVVGNAASQPFMHLTPAERRRLIEDLLELHSISKMKEILAKKKKTIAQNYETIKDKALVLSTKIQSAEEQIRNAAKESADKVREIDEKISALKTENDQLEEQIKALEKKLRTLKKTGSEKIDSLKKNQGIISQEIISLKSKKVSIEKNIELFNSHDECPVCASVIDSLHSEQMLSKLKIESNDLILELETHIDQHTYLGEEISICTDDLEKGVRLLDKKLNPLHKTYTNNLNTISSLNMTRKSFLPKPPPDIDPLKDQLKDVEKKKKTFQNMAHIIDTSITALKDDGLRSMVITKYLPFLNDRINHYLEELDFFAYFKFDENFKETIKARHIDTYTYDSFSEGEKQRMNLALLFAWRDLAKAKNSLDTNLFVLDETFDSSIDNEGLYGLIQILQNMGVDKNILVITHRDMDDSHFDRLMRFKKDGNFSSLEIL